MKGKLILTVIIFILLAGAAGGGYIYFKNSRENQVIATVKDFYKYEKKGDFGSSWELFHSQMKKHFKKADYIQKRTHVLMQDFDTKTFTFKIGKLTHIKNWHPGGGAKVLKSVYKVPVTQTFHSVFGIFSIEQDVYLSMEKGDWKILWKY
ncbi:hypothetical protein EV207_1305 [Scopulibacillus darangshiensis]|uniref:Uncharacterized protein n=1 Tax=Scopulibacillus darangshiensis TaxID=442528 RepID=A0A4R2NQ39_9BACL|nr:hypothetical protein [Scopulibacillus darangshiensis]TCP23488.1 hypothetical protein EV207_1305 [Scopulibacillus darangshiensis]